MTATGPAETARDPSPAGAAPPHERRELPPDGALYVGRVTHHRLRPRPHSLSYRVFAMLLDLDRLDALDRRLRLFSRGGFNLFAFHDRDHGPGDGTPFAVHLRAVLAAAGHDVAGGRLLLLCYPRVLGYVFNPLSVVYAYDSAGRLAAVVYEVNNTVGERTSYVVGIDDPAAAVHAQACAKEMYVSPFTAARGEYGFRLTEPGDDLVLAVTLRDSEGALLKTLFCGHRAPLDDWALARLALTRPLMTLKVIAAIHLEALRLWLKGVPVVRRHVSPRYSVSAAAARPADDTPRGTM